METSVRDEALALDFAYQDFPLLSPSETVQSALNKFRSRGLKHKIIYFYVADESRHLLGVLPTRLLLTSDLDAKVEELYVRKMVTLPADATMKEARAAFSEHQFLAFPVVDENNRILGVLDIQPFAGKLEDIHERTHFDDIYQLLGLQTELSESASAFQNFRMRFPWLISTIVAGSVGAFLASHYEVTLREQIALAFFLTMTLGLNESVCMQSATLAIQRLHQPEKAPHGMKAFLRVLFKELRIAAMLGSACGLIVAALVWIWRKDAGAAVAIGLSLLLTFLASCAFGLSVPPFLRRMQSDPKVAAAPIALGLADVSTLALYFWVARSILG